MEMDGDECRWLEMTAGSIVQAQGSKPQEDLKVRTHETVGSAQWHPHSGVLRDTG